MPKHDCLRHLKATVPSDSYLGRAFRANSEEIRPEEDDPDSPLDVLTAIRELRGELDEAEIDAALTARQYGATWQQIANAMGTTRQRVHQRWGNFDRVTLRFDFDEPPPYNRTVICYICGRKGERGFTQSSGNGDGTADSWRCTSRSACAKREAAKAEFCNECGSAPIHEKDCSRYR